MYLHKINIALSLGAQELNECGCQSIANQGKKMVKRVKNAHIPGDSFITNTQKSVVENLIVSLWSSE